MGAFCSKGHDIREPAQVKKSVEAEVHINSFVVESSVQHSEKVESNPLPAGQAAETNSPMSGGVVERVPSFQAERTPSEWERAFLADQAEAMGGEENVTRGQSFDANRTPSEWERAFLAEQAAAMSEAPVRASSFSQMSPEDLEKEFMRQMQECMGNGSAGASLQSNQSPHQSPRRGVGPHVTSPRRANLPLSASSARTASTGSASSSGSMTAKKAREHEKLEAKKSAVFAVLAKATHEDERDLAGMHLPNSFAINRIPSAGRGSAQIGGRVPSLEMVKESETGENEEDWPSSRPATGRISQTPPDTSSPMSAEDNKGSGKAAGLRHRGGHSDTSPSPDVASGVPSNRATANASPLSPSSPTATSRRIPGLNRSHSDLEMQLADLLAVAEAAGGIVLTSPIAESFKEVEADDRAPLQPYSQSDAAASDSDQAGINDSFRRGRQANRHVTSRRRSGGQSSSNMLAAISPEDDSDDGSHMLRTPSPPARTASEAHGELAMRSRLAARAVLNKARVEGEAEGDKDPSDMDRTPSEWEREFASQQAAAMAETACAPQASQRQGSNDSQCANRTASDWVKAFEQERQAVMNS